MPQPTAVPQTTVVPLTTAPGPMHAIQPGQPTAPVGAIAYFKVTHNGPGSYSYDTNTCGYYSIPAPGGALGMATFIANILQGPPGTRLYPIVPYGPNNLDFTLDHAYPWCYVVFQLNTTGSSWQYRYSADGVETNDATAGDYINLEHVDDAGYSKPGSGIIVDSNATAPTTPYHVVYFIAKTPSQRGTGSNPTPDGFNLWVTFPLTGDDEIDPDIKNTGHP